MVFCIVSRIVCTYLASVAICNREQSDFTVDMRVEISYIMFSCSSISESCRLCTIFWDINVRDSAYITVSLGNLSIRCGILILNTYLSLVR